MDQTPEGSQPAEQQPPAVPPPPAAPATPPPAAPPTTPPPAMPPPVAGGRPGVITAVAVLQFVAAGFGILFGVLALLGGGILAGADTSQIEGVEGLDIATDAIGGLLIVLAVISLVIAAVQIYAGTQVLKLRERGRIISIVLSAISLALMALSLTQGSDASGAVLSIALNGFILWACISNKDAFSEQGV